MQSLIPAKDIQKPHRVSDEVLLGMTMGGYIILAVTLYCFGDGLASPGLSNDVPPFRPYSADPLSLLWLAPGILVGALSFLQVDAERLFNHPLGQQKRRVALWLNALGSLGFCLMVALKREPDVGFVPADDYIFLAVESAAFAAFALGILVSIFNILSGLIRLRNA